MIKFGTDGWRDVIGDKFTFENVKIVSQAVSDYLKSSLDKKGIKVVVGYDQRFLSQEFACTVAGVLGANGIYVDVSNIAVPTPVVSFQCRYKGYDLGIMITASHNPYQFNGFKIKTPEGGGADKVLTDNIEKIIHRNKNKYKSQDFVTLNNVKIKDLTNDYIKFIRQFINIKEIRKKKLKIIVDTMYGSGNSFLERILDKDSNIKINYLHNEFNPSFGKIHPEPVQENLKELIYNVKKYNYNLGLALDGDADRLAVVTNKGEYINAQILLPLLAIHMVKNRGCKKGVGKTVVGSNLIDEVSLSLGVNCYETPVGFKYISSLFKKGLISIGGEEAGGIGFEGYIPERDGTVAFLMLLEMLVYENKDLDGILKVMFSNFSRWYYDREAISLREFKSSLDALKIPARILGKKVLRVNKMDGVKIITEDFWLMFRKSGTEPIIRLYAEAKEKKLVRALLELGKKMIYDL